jgi:OmpA-OmpF porin, OOP family
MKSWARALTGVCMLTLAAAPAIAVDPAFYGGASVGRSEAADFCAGVVGRCDDTDLGWRLFVGYEFNPNLAIEAGYVNFGNFSMRGIVPGLQEFGELDVSVDSSGWFVKALGIWPVNPDFSLHVKLGAANTRADFEIDQFADFDERGIDFVAGFGAAYRITWNLWIRAEYERYNNVGDTGEDMTLLSGTLIYRF